MQPPQDKPIDQPNGVPPQESNPDSFTQTSTPATQTDSQQPYQPNQATQSPQQQQNPINQPQPTISPSQIDQPQDVQPTPFQPVIIQPTQGAPSTPNDSTAPQTYQPNQPQTTPAQPITQTYNSVSQPTVSGPVVNQPTVAMGPSPGPVITQGKSKKPLIFAGVFAAFLVLAVIGAFTFAIYLPNTPENVWSTGLSRTGKEAEAVIEKITDPATIDSLSKNKLKVAGEVTSDQGNFKINVDSLFDQKKSDSSLSFDAESEGLGAQNISLEAKVKTAIQEESIFPNVFFQISGFSSLGLDAFLPGINDYEGKWIAVEQDFYQDTISELGESEEDISNITQQDITSIAKDVVDVSQDYIFTSDPERAVIVLEEFIGTEESEGITANHYKASINLENSAAFCNAVSDKLLNDNEAFRRIEGVNDGNIEEKRESAKEDCAYDEENDDLEELNKPFDIWMDKKHKIFHKVRFYEDLEKKNASLIESKSECEQRNAELDFQSNSGSFCDFYDDQIEDGEKYVEVGQVYDGNDAISIFVNQKNDTNKTKSNLRGDIKIDINTLTYNGAVSYEDTTNDSRKLNAKLTVSTEPYDGEIDTEKPAGAVGLQAVIDDLMNRSSAEQQSFSPQELGANTDENSLQETETIPNPAEQQSANQRFIDFLRSFLQ